MPFNSIKKIASRTLFIAIIGYITGILTAPKSGKETRQDLSESIDISKRELEKKLKLAHSELRSYLKEAQVNLISSSSEVKFELESVIKKANEVEAKIKETLSAVHEGTADNIELDKAIKEAKKSIKHFQEYINNK